MPTLPSIHWAGRSLSFTLDPLCPATPHPATSRSCPCHLLLLETAHFPTLLLSTLISDSGRVQVFCFRSCPLKPIPSQEPQRFLGKAHLIMSFPLLPCLRLPIALRQTPSPGFKDCVTWLWTPFQPEPLSFLSCVPARLVPPSS